MSLLGWKERISQVESGTFWCPNCRRDAPYTLKLARMWFHCIFMPVFPESRPLRFAHCQRCQGQFDPGILKPVASSGLEGGPSEGLGEGDWSAGTRVLAVWPIEQIFWYPATVQRSTPRWVDVHYDDGHKARVKPSEVMHLDIENGSRVYARFQSGPYYHPAEVTAMDGEKISLEYDDGRREETTLSVVRIMRGPGADVAWEVGQRVLAPFDQFYYPATITHVSDDLAELNYDDGDSASIPRSLLRILDLRKGDLLYCRWQGGSAFLPAVLEDINEDEISVRYDDGRREETTLSMIRVFPQELHRN